MKTAYKFTDKDLGKLFMSKLEEMGYKLKKGWGFDADHFSETLDPVMIYFDGEYLGVHNHKDHGGAVAFQLESQWNEALEWAKEQLEPRLENGKWYRGIGRSGGEFLGVYDENKKAIAFGFWEGSWNGPRVLCWQNHIVSFEEATLEEVEQALVKEAERRGYKNGNFNCVILHTPTSHLDDSYKYVDGGLFLNGNAVYYKGKWAEIISNKFFDWDTEKVKGGYKIGCEIILTSDLRALKKWLPYVKDKSVQEVINELDKILK